ncbi:Group XIIB secretory phospholipase A2-like protein [Dissostichus eleginoides]|uniref:Group XIIB secretory phospholipase A2-like protein n=1 Tax=Dissostichus eleginoides TaxID=100907 RepID=A0AAD9FNK2_DISEL|nr:Group XIIB secretory phospholipase A2-like protein [Dissostichus eleginoides]
MLFRTVLLLTLCLSTGMSATLGFYLAQAKEEEAPTVETLTHGIVEAAPVSTVEEHVVPADPKEDDPPAEEEHVALSDPKEDDPPGDEEHVTPSDPKEDDPPGDEEHVAPSDPKEDDPPGDEEHVAPSDPKEDDPPVNQEDVAPADPKEDDPPAEEEHVAPSDPQADDPPANEEDVVLADPKEEDPFAAEEPEANTIVGDNQVADILEVDNVAAGEPEVDVPVAEEPETRSDDAAGDAPALEDLTEAEGEAVTQEQPEAEEDNEIKPVQTEQSQDEPEAAEEEKEEDNSWGFYSIRNSFQSMHGYYNTLVELVGGRDGVCQYRCKYGEIPKPRPGYQLPEPNGCSSSLVGFQLDLGIPAMTNCCDMLDMCYDTCGASKNDCDSEFRLCVHSICSDLKKSLGFVSKVKACESMADALHSTVGTLGCRPYMNSQRAACVCEGEERDEL